MADLTSNLIHHWKFDGDATDSIAGDDFTAPDAYSSGVLGSSAQVDAASSVLNAGDIADADFGAGDSFTVSLWIKFSESPTGLVRLLAKKNNTSSTGDAGWSCYYTAGQVIFLISDGVTRAYWSSVVGATEYLLVTAVINRSSNVGSLYLNGELVDNIESNGPLSAIGSLDNAINVSVYTPPSGSSYFDDIRIYSRALSPEDVAGLYLEGKPPSLRKKLELSPSAIDSALTDYATRVGTASISTADNTAIMSTDTGSGADVWFSSDEAGTLPISADIFYWDDAGSVFGTETKITSVSAVSGATVYLQVGSKPGGYDADPYPTAQTLFAPLCTNLNDRTANSNDGVDVGSVTVGGVTGPDGSIPATAFNGTTQGVNLPGGSTLYPSAGDAAVELWFKDDAHSAGIETLFEAGDSATGVHIHVENGSVYGVLIQASASIPAGAAYTAGDWHHVALVVTDGVGIELFLDGVSVDTTAHATAITGYAADAGSIGKVASSTRNQDGTVGTTNFAAVSIAHVAAYDATRSAAEINADYLLQGSTASSYWTVTDVSGSVVGGLSGIIGNGLF